MDLFAYDLIIYNIADHSKSYIKKIEFQSNVIDIIKVLSTITMNGTFKKLPDSLQCLSAVV